MQLHRLVLAVALAVLAIFQVSAAQPEPAPELSQNEARTIAAQLSRQFIDRLYELRAASELKPSSNAQERAKDDDDFNDSDDSTTKLINKAAHALRPIVKEFSNVVNSAIPAGPGRQLVKATADAVDSLMPLILKYALGI
ncbi:hypothetical protein LPJ55_001996 [Coemansia sp. RSA 990]|nr:hypothetical protein BX667DRAFT_506861 [Coemansia mojavensis]KAJ1742820.1 hypothetical protein LPJ68_001522 [Coemansia sp. RSA 1086]KAJ1873862.1 hypothetical protein LPJ55_001996 [Coemansia sp. RSA 990]KAJ2670399.1 hypothetical protein IWW42_003968 [Coemansia sp. RSA 1085]